MKSLFLFFFLMFRFLLSPFSTCQASYPSTDPNQPPPTPPPSLALSLSHTNTHTHTRTAGAPLHWDRSRVGVHQPDFCDLMSYSLEERAGSSGSFEQQQLWLQPHFLCSDFNLPSVHVKTRAYHNLKVVSGWNIRHLFHCDLLPSDFLLH